MDYDNDGVLDFISGSYDPGDIYLFRGQGNGKYAAVKKIMDKDGVPIVHHPKELVKYEKMTDDPSADEQKSIEARVASFGSWVAPVDWEADGDLDLLIGSFSGNLFLRVNEGSREEPAYNPESVQVEANGEPLHVNMHAAPVVADWNRDGLWDLVVGSGDGAVGWFENTGSKVEPKFGAYQQLVTPASDSKFFEQNLEPGEEPAHGVRAQICVTDYNLDGRLDLIIGDYSDVNRMRKLSKASRTKFDELMNIQARMIAAAQSIRKAYYEDQENEELKTKLERFQKEYEKLSNMKSKYFTSNGRASFIWLFLRNDDALSQVDTGVNKQQTVAAPQETDASKTPVTLKATLDPIDGAEGLFELTVELEIRAGWHTYAGGFGSTGTPTRLELDLASGIEAVSDWQQPVGVPSLKDPGQKIYKGRVTFTRTIRVSEAIASTPIPIKVNYQACTDKYCLPPAVLEGEVTTGAE